MVVVVWAFGCSDSAPGAGGSGEGAAAPIAGAGRCDGSAVECYKVDSISSCFNHLGCNHVTDECEGKQVSCDLIDEQAKCVNQMGCFWETPDGDHFELPTGTCTGAAVPCGDLTEEAVCADQSGFNGYSACEWDEQAAACDRDYAVYSECGAWNDVQIQPSEAERQCNGRLGCSWVAD